MHTLLLLIGAWACPAPEAVVQTWNRAEGRHIPLRADGPGNGTFGEANRKADHATVATNSAGDVLVAFHSSRPTFDENYPLLKQVEIALLTYDKVAQTWSLVETNQAVVGSCRWSPISQGVSQAHVKCERPDVIAVGEWFFVVWTRIYQREYSSNGNQDFEPAVLECAWVRNHNGNLEVYTGSASPGLGFELDRHRSNRDFHVRECGGCPDAVVLHTGDLDTHPTVGIVYPHQTNFGDYGSTPDGTRLFELRFLTCSINPSSFAITSDHSPATLIASDGIASGLVFDGDNDAAGIVLPDVAPGSVPWRFGLAYEEQLATPTVTNGRIHLELWDVVPTRNGYDLTRLENHAFGNSNATFYRRRPILSSYPAAFPGRDVFAIAFNKLSAAGEGDVVYQEWLLTAGARAFYWSGDWGWDQGCDDRKPVPLLGREVSVGKYFGRCYAECTSNSELIKYVRVDDNVENTPFSMVTANQLQRPAAAYWFDELNDSDNVALTWEQETAVGRFTPVQVWLRME